MCSGRKGTWKKVHEHGYRNQGRRKETREQSYLNINKGIQVSRYGITCARNHRGVGAARLRALRLRREAAEGAGRRGGRHGSWCTGRVRAAVGRQARRCRLLAERAPRERPLGRCTLVGAGGAVREVLCRGGQFRGRLCVTLWHELGCLRLLAPARGALCVVLCCNRSPAICWGICCRQRQGHVCSSSCFPRCSSVKHVHCFLLNCCLCAPGGGRKRLSLRVIDCRRGLVSQRRCLAVFVLVTMQV